MLVILLLIFFFAFFCSRFCFYYNFCFTSDIFFFFILLFSFVHSFAFWLMFKRSYIRIHICNMCIKYYVYVCMYVMWCFCFCIHSYRSLIIYHSFRFSRWKKKQQNSHKILWFPMKRYLVPMNVAFYRRLPNEIESSKIITVTPYDESD